MAQYGYQRAGAPRKTNSAAAYGSVMHHSLDLLERMIYDARLRHPDPRDPAMTEEIRQAVDAAARNFVHYWMPANIEAICEPVPPDGWLPRQGFNEMRTRGVEAIQRYADLIRFDDHELLAIEFGFNVPIEGTWDDDLGEPHRLAGSVDRLAARYYSRRLCCCIDDWKTGKEQVYLRHNLQFTSYCLATTTREFWVGDRGEDGFGKERGEELYERFADSPRRATWINLRTSKFVDAGYRIDRDYARLGLAIEQLAASVKADIYPLTLTGAACQYCDYRHICGGIGLAEDSR
jgi:PD-(D/E)XK nuclease superfamily